MSFLAVMEEVASQHVALFGALFSVLFGAMMSLSSPRFVGVSLVLGLLALSLLTGCSTLPFQVPAEGNTVPATPEAVINDLAAGSAVHALTAGDAGLAVNYWSTLSMNKWNAAASKPMTFSAVGTLGTDSGQSVYLSRVSVVTAVNGPFGALPSPGIFSDIASISPGYLVKAPYSYSQTFIIPAVDSTATSVTLSFTFELLIQASPGSTDYAKQTVSDQLIVAIAP